MSDDLVKRLRDGCSCNIDSSPCMAEEECRDAYAAADRIEALEAKLAKAVEALKPFAQTLERYSGFRNDALFGIWEDVNGAAGRKLNILRKQNFDDARATLAELTGGKDE